MRKATHSTIVTALSAGFIVSAAMGGVATADTLDQVTFTIAVNGSTVTNTIANSTSSSLICRTSVAPAPKGVLPSAHEITYGGGDYPSNFSQVDPGTSVHTVTDIASGIHAVLASCVSSDQPATLWVANYPGIEDVLVDVPSTVHLIGPASPLIEILGQ
jgi:hypothetical protein